MSWTEEKVNKLKELWGKGNTASQIAEIISAEPNYDRWSPFLFPHSKSPDIYGRRIKQWEAKLPDGRVAESMIEVIPAQDAKSYTTVLVKSNRTLFLENFHS